MKRKPEPRPTDPRPALAQFEQLPEKTKELLALKQQSEKATGKTGLRIQKKLRKRSRS
jgi:hypothetical protein